MENFLWDHLEFLKESLLYLPNNNLTALFYWFPTVLCELFAHRAHSVTLKLVFYVVSCYISLTLCLQLLPSATHRLTTIEQEFWSRFSHDEMGRASSYPITLICFFFSWCSVLLLLLIESFYAYPMVLNRQFLAQVLMLMMISLAPLKIVARNSDDLIAQSNNSSSFLLRKIPPLITNETTTYSKQKHGGDLFAQNLRNSSDGYPQETQKQNPFAMVVDWVILLNTPGARCWNLDGWLTNKGFRTGTRFYNATSVKGVWGANDWVWSSTESRAIVVVDQHCNAVQWGSH